MKLRGLIALLSLAFATPALAVQPVTHFSLPSIADVRGQNLASKSSLSVDSYYGDGKGGGGKFSYIGTSCADDNGVTIKDGAGNCFHRTDWQGETTAYGLTNGSAYDVTANPTTALDATPRLQAALAAASASGRHLINTKQVSIRIGSILEMTDFQSFSCDMPSVGPFDDGHYTGRPGTLVISHGAYVHLSGEIDSEDIGKCIINPEWMVKPSVVSAFSGFSMNAPPQGYADLEAMRGNMIKAGDVAIFADGARSTPFRNLGIYGFDNAIYSKKANDQLFDGLSIDADVSVYTSAGASTNVVQNSHSGTFITRSVLNVGGTANIANEEEWDIGTVVASPTTNSFGTHLCRVTVSNGRLPDGTPVPATDLFTSSLNELGDAIMYPAWATNLNGAQTCIGFGPWAITVISKDATSATIDFQNSEYGTGADKVALVATWTTTAMTGCGGTCALVKISSGDIRAIQVNEVVAGTGIPVGTKILTFLPSCRGPDPYDGYIACFIIDHVPTFGGTDGALTLDGGAYVGSGHLYLNAAERVYAGTSAAGIATATLPLSRGHRYAASWFLDNTTGTRLGSNGSFGHHYGFVARDANDCNVGQNAADDLSELNDYSQVAVYDLGGTNKCLFDGGTGKTGTSFVVDLASATQDNSHQATLSGVPAGLGMITTNGGTNFSGWPADGAGHTTATICQTLTAGTCGSVSEIVTIDITGSTTAKVLGRGGFNTAQPASVWTTGAFILQTNIAPKNDYLDVHDSGATLTDTNLTVFELEHGSASFSNTVVKGGGRVGYISDNFLGASFTDTNFKDLTAYYDSTLAESLTSGCNPNFSTQQPWECFQPNAVMQVANVAAIAARPFNNAQQLWLNNYYGPPDNGGGPLQQVTCTPNTYNCFADKNGVTYKRSNPQYNVDMCGATVGGSGDQTAAIKTCIDAAWTAGSVVRFSPGTYNITGLKYYPGSQIVCDAGSILKMSADGFGFRSLVQPGDAHITGAVNAPKMTNCTVDMNGHHGAAFLLESTVRGDFQAPQALNVADGTFSYDDGTGAQTYPDTAFMLKGIPSVFGTYYNRLIHPLATSQTAQGARCLWFGTTIGGSTAKANFNYIEAPNCSNSTTSKGFDIAADVELGNDNIIVQPEFSYAGICLQLGGTGLSSVQRTQVDKLYCERGVTEAVNFTTDASSNIVTLASTSLTPTQVVDNGSQNQFSQFGQHQFLTGGFDWNTANTTPWTFNYCSPYPTSCTDALHVNQGAASAGLTAAGDFSLVSTAGNVKVPSNALLPMAITTGSLPTPVADGLYRVTDSIGGTQYVIGKGSTFVPLSYITAAANTATSGSVTLTSLVDARSQRFTGTKTGNITVTLSTTNGSGGQYFYVENESFDGFNLQVTSVNNAPSHIQVIDGGQWALFQMSTTTIWNVIAQGRLTDPATLEDKGTLSSGTAAFNANLGKEKHLGVGGNLAISFTGWLSPAKLDKLHLYIDNGSSHTITWPTITWLAGSPPSLRASGTNEVDVYTFDGGVTLYGELIQ